MRQSGRRGSPRTSRSRTVDRDAGKPPTAPRVRRPLRTATRRARWETSIPAEASTSAPPAATGLGSRSRTRRARHHRVDQRLRARRSPSVVSARFEGGDRRAPRCPRPCGGERHGLGVRSAGALVPALADNRAGLIEDHAADARVLTGRSTPREQQRASHRLLLADDRHRDSQGRHRQRSRTLRPPRPDRLDTDASRRHHWPSVCTPRSGPWSTTRAPGSSTV